MSNRVTAASIREILFLVRQLWILIIHPITLRFTGEGDKWGKENIYEQLCDLVAVAPLLKQEFMFTYLPEKALSMSSWSQLELVIVGKDQSFCLSCNSAPWQEIDLKARFCHDTESTLTWISTAKRDWTRAVRAWPTMNMGTTQLQGQLLAFSYLQSFHT